MIWDCLVIGGGPAGLTGAIYLGRYRRRVLVFDAGKSRASAIPKSHNYPGFARGISGHELLARLREQAAFYGVEVRAGTIEGLAKDGEMFVARGGGATVRAARVLLATGIADRNPELPGLDDAVSHAAVRYCPVCDGYEAMDCSIAVLGPLEEASAKAVFLRTYSKSVTVLPIGSVRLPPACSLPADIDVAPRPSAFRRTQKGIAAQMPDGSWRAFDVLYPALGCNVHSRLATALGAKTTAAGFLIVDSKQQTCVPNLYAAGDVVSDLHQLSVAEGHAAIAATAIHNGLTRNFR
jgi:thioredoxin reductase (NADPH)